LRIADCRLRIWVIPNPQSEILNPQF